MFHGRRLPRALRATILAGLVLSSLSAAPRAAGCAGWSADVPLAPGETLRLDGTAFTLLARRLPAAEQDAAWEPPTRLALDLLVQRVGKDGLLPVPGTYVPHLAGRFAIAGPSGELARGPLEFRFPSAGPAYGATVELPAAAAAGTLGFEVTLEDRSVLVERPACPAYPLTLRFAVRPADAPQEQTAGTAIASPADNLRFQLVGQLDPLNQAGNQYSDIWGYSDGTTHLAIVGALNETHFIDVTDPGNPVEVGAIGGVFSTWRDIKTYQHYAYIVTEGNGGGLQIVDLSSPTSPVLANQTTAFFVTAHNIYIDTDRGLAWVVGANNGTQILDLTQDPENPTLAGSWTTRYVHDAYAAGDYAYFSEIFDGVHEILGATNPASLQVLASWATPSNFTHNSWANDAQTVVATTDEKASGKVGVYDITSKTGPNPELSRWWSGTNAIIHNVMFDDEDNDRLGISHYTLGIKYVDLHVPELPVLLASYDTYPLDDDNDFDGAWGVYMHDPRGLVYGSDRDTGLYVLQYTPSGGTLSGTVRAAATGTPLEGVQVQVLPAGVAQLTDAAGRYAVYVDAGELLVRVTAPGYRTGLAGGVMPLGDRLDIDLELETLAKVPLGGTVRRADTLAPIPNSTVKVVGELPTATTAGDGSFALAAVRIGQRVVTATALGFSPAEVRVMLSAGASEAADLLLEPGRFADDAESDLGWEFGVFDPGGIQGRWERADPNGTGGGLVQPEDDHTPDPGVTAFITGQSPPGADINDNDVEGGATTMRSPTMDATGLGAARLRYHRWFSNAAGAVASGKLTVEVNDGALLWTLAEEVTSDANSWTEREFDLGNLGLDLNDQIRVRFRALAGGQAAANQVLECAVDDVDLVSGCLARFAPALPNADGDAILDACDACPLDPTDDFDGDGFCGDVDNTPFTPGPDQTDSDGDLVGDVGDNCPATANTDQRDLDGDGLGDACDPDVDGDGTPNGSDPDDDDDGIPDGTDVCPTRPDPLQQDADLDGTGDLCDLDDGIVQGLRLASAGRILWVPEPGSDGYNLYRGDLGFAALVPFAVCRREAIPERFAVDLDAPLPDEGFFYLVTRTAGGVEGSPGFGSGGAERQLNNPCN